MDVIEILLNSMFNHRIKIYPKICNYPTIHKTDYDDNYVDRLLVASFAAPIIPNVFDGSIYIRCCEQMILWLMAMGIMDMAKGKPEQ